MKDKRNKLIYNSIHTENTCNNFGIKIYFGRNKVKQARRMISVYNIF